MTGLHREPPTIAPLIGHLDRHEVRYAVFGSGGAWCYGVDIRPGDFDICPALDAPNLQRLAAVLVAINARPRAIPGWITADESGAWAPEPATDNNLDHLFVTDFGDFDVVPRPFGPNGKADRFDYQRLDKRAATVDAAGFRVPVAGIGDLIGSKLSQRRAKDLKALPELERIRERLRTSGGAVDRRPWASWVRIGRVAGRPHGLDKDFIKQGAGVHCAPLGRRLDRQRFAGSPGQGGMRGV